MSRFCVVLVRPRDPNNMGACARAMGNFGLTDLRIVNPYPPIWQEAVSAVGVADILKNARCFDTLDEALADTHFSLAATALKKREVKQEIVVLPTLNDRLAETDGLTALVFGNEKTGLSNEDISRCQAILNIPTASKQPSINLAQAVILTCYELSRRADFKPLRSAPSKKMLPTDEQKELVVESLDRVCEKLHLRTDLTPAQRKAFLRSVLKESSLSKDRLFFIKKLVEKIAGELD